MTHDAAHLEAVARAYDAEDAATRGEPDPWSFGAEEFVEEAVAISEWQDERRACAAAALDVLLALGWTPPPAGGPGVGRG